MLLEWALPGKRLETSNRALPIAYSTVGGALEVHRFSIDVKLSPMV